MRLFSYFILFILLCGYNQKKKSKKVGNKAVREQVPLSKDSQIFLDNKLFSEKNCITCHDAQKETIAPSVKQIMKVYKEQNGEIVAFLKGTADPIVDTTASQVAIMQANINGFLKDITNEELETIAVYMLHVDQLNPNPE